MGQSKLPDEEKIQVGGRALQPQLSHGETLYRDQRGSVRATLHNECSTETAVPLSAWDGTQAQVAPAHGQDPDEAYRVAKALAASRGLKIEFFQLTRAA